MSEHIKGLDPHHLVLLGHSGVFGSSTPDMCAALKIQAIVDSEISYASPPWRKVPCWSWT